MSTTMFRLHPRLSVVYSSAIFLFLISIQTVPFEGYSLLSIPFLLAVISALMVSLIVQNRPLRLLKGQLWIPICSTIMLLSVLLSTNTRASLQYFSYFSVFGLVAILLSNSASWVNACINVQLFFSIAHASVTIISSLFPNIYMATVLPLYSASTQRLIAYWIANRTYPGLAGQLGTNSFVISLGLAVLISRIYSENRVRKVSHYFCGAALVMALFLTGKRGLLIGNILVALLVWYLGPLRKRSDRSIRVALAMFGIIALLYPLSLTVPTLGRSIGRFQGNLNEVDFSSGRIQLYSNAIKLIGHYYLLGSGINSYTTLSHEMITDVGAHNDLLQMLVELGIFMTIPFVAFVMWCLAYTRKLINYTESDAVRTSLYVSLYVQCIMIFYSLIGNPFYYYNMLFTYFIFIAIPMSLSLELKRQKEVLA